MSFRMISFLFCSLRLSNFLSSPICYICNWFFSDAYCVGVGMQNLAPVTWRPSKGERNRRKRRCCTPPISEFRGGMCFFPYQVKLKFNRVLFVEVVQNFVLFLQATMECQNVCRGAWRKWKTSFLSMAPKPRKVGICIMKL